MAWQIILRNEYIYNTIKFDLKIKRNILKKNGLLNKNNFSLEKDIF